MSREPQDEREHEHEHADEQIGRILSRRELLAILGAAGGGLLAGCARPGGDSTPATASAPPTGAPAAAAEPRASVAANATSRATEAATAVAELPACVVRPEQTEGPYFVDERLERADIRADTATGVLSEGRPLELRFRVSRVAGEACAPLAGALVDVWHCDALGRYSDVADARSASQDADFLRGYQVTDASGEATFTTIYPGWYPGRTVHIHVKIRADEPGGGTYDFTSQVYFDDALSDRVFQAEPYAGRGDRAERNESDGIYRSGGEQLTLEVKEQGDTLRATFDVGLLIG